MNILLQPLLYAVLPIVITVVGGLAGKLLYSADQKLKATTGIEVGEALRNKLHSAAMTALTAALSKYSGLGAMPTDPVIAAAINEAIGEVFKLNPDTITAIKQRAGTPITPTAMRGVVETVVKSKLPDVIQSISWATQAINEAAAPAPKTASQLGAGTTMQPGIPSAIGTVTSGDLR